MVRHKMAELGHTISDAKAEALLTLVKETAVKLNRPLQDEEFFVLADQVVR
jgi:hypothetical protein